MCGLVKIEFLFRILLVTIMKKRLALGLFLLFVSSLFATEDLPDLQASKEVILDTQENYFLTSTDTRITPKVNPITGEYCEEEVDLVVAGSQPISIRRFYNSSAPEDGRYANWRYNPECFFVANFELHELEIFASIGEADGSVCAFKRSSGDQTLFQFEVPKHFLAFQADGSSHPLNTKIQFSKGV